VFWMWMTALVGMATKYAETFLAVTYREKSAGGHYLGGPMYYIKMGLGPKWAWMGTLFAIFASFAAFGVGSGIQANSIADVLESEFQVPLWVTALVLLVAAYAVLVGGLQRLAAVASHMVPSMIVLFMGAGVVVLAINAAKLPDAFMIIVDSAFNGTAAAGGFVGAAVAATMRYGVARGIFSNEAGLGSAAILHAAARSNDAVRMGGIGMLGTFIDTLVVNSVTALVIVSSGAWMSGETGAPLTALAYENVLPGVGGVIVAVSLAVFAFTTILGWCVYGERCAAYLFGDRIIVPYRHVWCLVLPVGAMMHLELIWIIADIMNALMAVPNLIALLLLGSVVFKLTGERLAGGNTLMGLTPEQVAALKERKDDESFPFDE
jgi:AGCS family alanine or glycine:cation symporter